ncbi:MAG: response regulator transcription factor, partial [Acidobacteriota bacterium]|nr:response regulator transcription factor [Acidobacteriota bacterium]
MTRAPHLLVVEDDRSLREGLATALAAAGYRVSTAIRGQEALEVIRHNPPDLVLLDLMLPGLDGSYVLQAARKEGYQGPVIILSARDTPEDKIYGLHAGADDYVTKPFDLGELLARIVARLRRQDEEPTLTVGAIEIDFGAGRVYRNGEAVHLTPKEFDVLALLARSHGRALSRSRIVEEVWGPEYRGTRRTVDNIIYGLRSKLEEDPESPRLLLTVRARGYCLDPSA